MPAPFSQLIAAIKMANYQRLRKRREPQRIAYQKWVAQHDVMTDQKRAELQAQYDQLGSKPLISIIMPVYNAPLGWLDEAIESVRNQVYQNWELCIADDRSSDPAIRPYLEGKAAQDDRIRIEFRQSNGHISAASNSAIALAKGDFLTLMDQDDLIPPYALLAVAQSINSHPDAGLIYSDEDKIDEQGNRESPTKKEPWKPDLLTDVNRLSHLSTYRTSLVRQLGGFRLGYEGAQDHDLALRCVEQLNPEQIVYIPKVLYHWRIHEHSTARDKSTKPYALTARKLALKDHFARMSERQ